jgi:hypothetical protein
VLSAAGVLYRIQSATGARLGSLETGSPEAPGLAALPDDSGFLAASFGGRVRGYGFELAPLPVDFEITPFFQPPAAGGGRLFVPGIDRLLRAYELPSGAPLWERALPVALAGPAAISDDGSRVAVGDLAGTVWMLDAASGDVRSRNVVSSTAVLPAWAVDRLVVTSEAGLLLLLDAGRAASTASF